MVLSKISPTKASLRVNLTKPVDSQGVMRVNSELVGRTEGFFGR